MSSAGAEAALKQRLESVASSVSSQHCLAPFSAAPLCRNRMINVIFCLVSGISSGA